MSNISRRQFLKSAGVAALAAGVLAGCGKIPGTDVPDVPEVTSETIDVLFFDTATGKTMGAVKTMSVLKGAKNVKVADIPTDLFPKGYGIEKENDIEIRDGGEGLNRRIMVWVKKGDVINANWSATKNKTSCSTNPSENSMQFERFSRRNTRLLEANCANWS